MKTELPASVATMFYDASTKAAVVVRCRAAKRSARARRWPQPHAALDWCIKHRATFVFIPSVSVSPN
jgi:hypothetical protein